MEHNPLNSSRLEAFSDGVIYSQRLSAKRTQSRLSKVMGTPLYKSMTIRSWNTTTKLLEILRDMDVHAST